MVKLNTYISLMLVLILSSCSMTPIQIERLDENKAHFDHYSGDIVLHHNVYSRSFFKGEFDAQSVYPDNDEARKLLEKSNESIKAGRLWISAGIYSSAIYYVLMGLIQPKNRGLALWLLLGIGVVPPIQYSLKARDEVQDSVDKYNENYKEPAFSYSFGF